MPTALVTGASRGIGRAVVMRLARDGYDIVAVARSEQDLASLSGQVQALHRECRTIALDLTDRSAIATALVDVDADVLVNNAGLGIMKPMVDMSADEWHRMIDLNVNALFHVTRAVLPGMIARGRGHVCTIGSIAARAPYAGGSCYSGTKAFVTAWAESLMLEVRASGVRVSVISPGGVATDFSGHAPTDADAWKLRAEDVADAVAYVLGAPGSMLVHRAEVRTLKVPPSRRG